MSKPKPPPPRDKLLEKALAEFPALVREKKQAAQKREKILKAFAPLSRELKRKLHGPKR